MKHIIRRHTISVKHALNGLQWAFSTQPNFKVHLILSSAVIFFGYFFGISIVEWLLITLVITLGLVIEMVNTALEATTDAIDKTIRDDIKIAKDVAAGAMLLYAVGAIVIAMIIFIPKIVF